MKPSQLLGMTVNMLRHTDNCLMKLRGSEAYRLSAIGSMPLYATEADGMPAKCSLARRYITRLQHHEERAAGEVFYRAP